MKRVYVASPIYPSKKQPELGTFVETISDELAKNGFSVSLPISRFSTIFGTRNSSEKLARYLLLCLDGIVLFFRRKTIIYLHLPTWFSIVYLPAMILRGMPLIVNLHGSEIHKRNKLAQLFWPITRLIIRKSVLVVVPSESFRESAELQLGELNYFVSPSGGVDMEKFSPNASKHIDALNAEKSDTIFVGYVSRLVEAKGPLLFVQTIKILRDKGLPVTGLMVGSGPLAKQVEKAIKERGTGNMIRYFGPRPHSELPQFFASMDVFAFTSKITSTDSLGLVALEALSMGTPVVAFDSPLTREYICPKINGELATDWTALAFAEKIEEIAINRPYIPHEIRRSVQNCERKQVARMLALAIISSTEAKR